MGPGQPGLFINCQDSFHIFNQLKIKRMTLEQMKIERLRTENEMLKQLVKYGKIYINYDSSDCDGGHSGGSLTFTSVDEVYKWEEDKAEWADGPFGWRLAEPNDIQEEYRYFTR
jgi:hypothetical protein